MANPPGYQPAPDGELLARQGALQAEATAILAELAVAEVFGDAGPMLLAGSYVSGLMGWPDLDVMVHVGPDFAPHDVLQLLRRLVDLPGVVAFDYRDERGPGSPTGTVRDERYHVVVSLPRNDRTWRIDLTLWLNDPHRNVTTWHEDLRETVYHRRRARQPASEACSVRLWTPGQPRLMTNHVVGETWTFLRRRDHVVPASWPAAPPGDRASVVGRAAPRGLIRCAVRRARRGTGLGSVRAGGPRGR
jgi:hypothetical protein